MMCVALPIFECVSWAASSTVLLLIQNPPSWNLDTSSACLSARCPSAPLSPLAVHWKRKTCMLETDLPGSPIQLLKLLATSSTWPTDLAEYIPQSRRHCISFHALIYQGIVWHLVRNEYSVCAYLGLPPHKCWSTETRVPIGPNFLKWRKGKTIDKIWLLGFWGKTKPLKLLANSSPPWPTDLAKDIRQSRRGNLSSPPFCLCTRFGPNLMDKCSICAVLWIHSCKC